jgi:predicted ATPase
VAEPAPRPEKTADSDYVLQLKWCEHGPYVAKGTESSGEPTVIFEVGTVGLSPFQAPADSLKMWRLRRDNLPDARTRFVGRLNDLEQIDMRFKQKDRLVTILGPGGGGKTRLAIEYARGALNQLPQGVWFVALEAVLDGSLIAFEILRALRLPEPADNKGAAAALIERVHDWECLIVLDNCEHLAEAPGQLVAALLGGVRRCRVLATSRVPLNVESESKLRLPPLSLPPEGARTAADLAGSDAVELFLERLRLNDRKFELTDDVAPVVAQICLAVAGMPLAIRLICASLRSMPLTEVVRQLERMLPLLYGGAVDDPVRQRTMDAAIQWSVESLSAPARELFRRLSVFSGGWSMAAAEAVCADPQAGLLKEQVREAMGQLCDSSLVVFEDPGPRPAPQASVSAGKAPDDVWAGADTCYRFLEPIRQFAAVELQKSGNEGALRDRHADYFRTLAEVCDDRLLDGAQQRRGLEVVESNHKNLLAAIRWCATGAGAENEGAGAAVAVDRALIGLRIAAPLWMFWDLRGYFTVGRAVLDIALRAIPADTHLEDRAKALNAGGYLAARQGDYADARRRSAQSLRIRRALGDRSGESRNLTVLGNAAVGLGRTKLAERYYRKALKKSLAWGKRNWRPIIYARLGELLMRNESFPEAEEHAKRSLATARDIGNRAWEAIALHLIGDLCRRRGDVPRAKASYREALEIGRAIDERPRIAVTLAAVAGLVLDGGDAVLAAQLLAAAEQLGSEIGTPPPTSERLRFEEGMRELRANLGGPRIPALWQPGSGRPWEAAVDAAMAWL